jgi:hypothetical protein
MDDTQNIAGKISGALDAAAQCASQETARNYDLLGEHLGGIETAVGELLRSHVAYRPLLAKLQQGGQLAPDEFEALRSLVVGDADEYLKYDDDFEQSKKELNRILEQIRQLDSHELDIEALKRLRVLCREASNALTETSRYVQQKERVRNFEDHTRDALTDDVRRMLASMVERMAG